MFATIFSSPPTPPQPLASPLALIKNIFKKERKEKKLLKRKRKTGSQVGLFICETSKAGCLAFSFERKCDAIDNRFC